MVTKKELKEYLRGNWDVHLKRLLKEMRLGEKDVPEVKRLLKELEEEKWVKKARAAHGSYEWDPGEKQTK